MELSYFRKALIIFGKSHIEGRPRHLGHVLSIIHNAVNIIGCLCVSLGMLLSVNGNFSFHIKYTIQVEAMILWCAVSSAAMFYMARRKLFIVIDPEQFHYTPKCLAKAAIVSALVLPFLYMFGATMEAAISYWPFYEQFWPKNAIDFFTNNICNTQMNLIAFVFILPAQVIVPYYIMVYCFLLAKEFEILYETMELSPDLFSKKGDSLQSFRTRYSQLCETVDKFNSSYGFLILISLLALSVIVICLATNLITSSMPPANFLPTFVIIIITLLLLLAFPAYLHDQGKRPLDLLVNAGVKLASDETYHQLNLFIKKVENFSGVTAMGFMNLDRPGAAGLLGLVVTYIVVIVQFDQSQSSTGCSCAGKDVPDAAVSTLPSVLTSEDI